MLRRIVPLRLRRAVRSRLVRVTEDAIREPLESLHVTERAHAASVASLAEAVSSLRSDTERMKDELSAQIAIVTNITASHFDRIPELRATLLSMRESEEYRCALSTKEPLVSVRIATYNRGTVLFERTIPSVLAQGYENLEVVIVGDGCDDDTEERARRMRDSRVRFVNMPHRGVYPAEPQHRWMVAGSPAMNLGAALSRGLWLAPLDDDDEFAPDHIEVLLQAALQGELEMAYGKYWAMTPPPWEPHARGTFPPEYGYFGFQTAIYMRALRFFQYETRSWVLNEPGDWNLCRRMREAGVRMGFVDRVVTTVYPTGPR